MSANFDFPVAGRDGDRPGRCAAFSARPLCDVATRYPMTSELVASTIHRNTVWPDILFTGALMPGKMKWSESSIGIHCRQS
jgi:hypothetical protein